MFPFVKKVWWWSLLVLYWISVTGSSFTQEISKIQQPITSAVHRRIRGLSYPEDSEMGIFFALAIPLDDPVSTEAISVAFFFEANYQLPKTETEEDNNEEESRRERSMNLQGRGGIDRRTTYSMLESKFEALGFPGRACLLRSICETSRNPLHYHNGLLGDLLRILFTPTTSRNEGLSSEYEKAANHSGMTDDCEATYPLCPVNIYDYITVLFGLGLPMESQVSMTLGYVLKCNYRLPYNASDFTDDSYVRFARATRPDHLNENLPPASQETGPISRWSLYRMLEMVLEPGGSSGKACLLRAVCESAESPLRDGVLSEILHVFLTPSTTSEEYEMYSDQEYHAAEKIGRNSNGEEACKMVYRECPYSPLNYFTAKSGF